MKVIGFGDFLIHFSPIMDERLMQANLMQMSFTGAEANVCSALGLWGESVGFVTRLPDHLLANRGISFLRSLSVNTDNIQIGDGRMGTYYLEKGRGIRPSVVIYDRNYSAFTLSDFNDYDWESIFDGCEYFYISGITPALSESVAECCVKAASWASARGIKVIYDVNYRPKLKSSRESADMLMRLSPYLTHLVGNEEHFKLLLELGSEFGEAERYSRLFDIAEKVRRKTKIDNVSITVRRTPSASAAVFSAAYMSNGEFALSDEYKLDVVDRVGSGDAFSAGFVYSLLHDFGVEETVRFAAASCAMKHAITNDVNFSSVSEILAIIEKNTYDVKR